MYPLLPLMLFNLRKELEQANKKGDIIKISKLRDKARDLAYRLVVDSIDLFSMDEIPGDDLQAMVTCICNLISPPFKLFYHPSLRWHLYLI